jgi:membrane protease YdiL (CAAX protease family)
MTGISDEGRRAGLHALYAWAVVAAMVAGLVHVNVDVPWVGHLGSALIAVVFLYAPMVVCRIRGEDLVDYGFHAAPIKKGLVIAGVAMLIIFPLFVLGYYAFYEIACGHKALAEVLPPGTCARYHGLAGMHAPVVTGKLLEWSLVQLVVVALPEELFFRGFLLGLLEKRFPPKRRILGGGVGLALLLSALAFAIIHVPKTNDPRDLATFFPALVFGWMRSATGSILASTLTHAGSNILVRLLELSLLR